MDENRTSALLTKASAYSACGLEFAVAVGLFTWLGHRADLWLGWTPALTLLGLLFGLALGFVTLIKVAQKLSRDTPDKKP